VVKTPDMGCSYRGLPCASVYPWGRPSSSALRAYACVKTAYNAGWTGPVAVIGFDMHGNRVWRVVKRYLPNNLVKWIFVGQS
jgi:hypothetical protein